MIRVIIILFLLTSSLSARENCKYLAEGEVLNQTIVNLKETYVCKEDENIFVQFITDEKYHRAFTMVFFTLLENL